MRVMEVNRKGWTAWCMDITCMGLRGVREEGGGGEGLEGGVAGVHTAPQLHKGPLTSWLTTVLFYNPSGIRLGRDLERMGGL